MLPTEPSDWAPAVLGALSAFADAIVGVGVVVPGEVVVTGLAVTAGGSQTLPLILLVTLGASLGDHLNFGLGRALGGRLADSRLVAAFGVQHWRRGERLLERHGPRMIVLTRLVPVVRTFAPAVAGASGLAYRRFLPASLTGSLLWATTWVLAGNVVTFVLAEARPVTALGALVLVGICLRSSLRRSSRPPRRPRRGGVTGVEAASSPQQRRDLTGA